MGEVLRDGADQGNGGANTESGDVMEYPQYPAPPHVKAVCLMLCRWEATITRFDREIIEGVIKTESEALGAVGPEVSVYKFRRTDGTTATIAKSELEYWKFRVKRLVTEAEKHLDLKDWNWFFWIDEFAGMKTQSVTEHFSDQFTAVIETGSTMTRSRKKTLPSARKAAAKKNKAKGQETKTKVRDAFNRRKNRRQSTDAKEIAGDLGMSKKHIAEVMKKMNLA